MTMIHSILIILILILPIVHPLKVLFYAYAIAQSHISFHHTAMKLLLEQGHSVDVVIAVYNSAVKLKLPKEVGKNYTFGYEDPDYYSNKATHLKAIFERRPIPWQEFAGFDDAALKLCKIAVNNDELLKFMKSEKYDIGIGNDYDPCGNIMFTAAGIPVTASIVPTPLFQQQVVSAGLPSLASLYGTVLYPKSDDSFSDKLFHLLRHTYNIYVVQPSYSHKYNELTRSKFGETFPDVDEIERNIDVTFVNSNEIIEQPRPISSKIKYIGGIGMRKTKPLTQEFESILSLPSKGVVLFSFGTQVPTKLIPIDIRNYFVEAFKQFPDYIFLWKYDSQTDNDNDNSEGVDNIKRVQWLPQYDLLQDKRIKLFISHMGLNSFIETASSGVPVLSIPLFIDQQHNAQNAKSLDIGRIVNRDNITVYNLVSTLKELLGNQKYGENAKIVSNMMASKPEKAEKTYIEWVEYAAKNPGLHKVLNLPGADQSPFYYYSGDIITTIIVIIITVLITISYLFHIILSKCRRSSNSSKLKIH